MIPNDATLAQINAANPKTSTWLSANAGSGKTRVLTDRVARMLLGGVKPQRILCLTYTKAAASEMQNRLFERLGGWAMMSNVELRASLSDLGLATAQLGDDILPQARRLFAQAIETPGGLKIQTIHSFCASLLRRFPLEAGVSPAFKEMDERSAKLLRGEILDEIALREPDAMAAIAAHYTGAEIDKLLAEIDRNRHLFETPPSETELRNLFGVSQTANAQSLLADVFLGGEADLIAGLLPALKLGKSTDTKLATNLSRLDLTRPNLSVLQQLEGLLLTKGGNAPFTPKTSPPTKNIRDEMPDAAASYKAFQERVASARTTRIALAVSAKTLALHQFAQAYLPRLDRHKQAAGWLDFDDLIQKARRLLSDPSVAAWVLFRLDGGIDHVLVDEAQDTSPAQWDVIRLLTEEFTSGQSARPEAERTIFVVGDQKQSIYSFQGADPQEFDHMRAHFADALGSVGLEMQQQELLYSFRSAKPVLSLVDYAFQGDRAVGMGERVEHRAFKHDLPGRVDLWDWIESTEKEDKNQWNNPDDTVANNPHAVLLAEKVAAFIKSRIAHGQITLITDDGQVTRRIRARDFLILVQRRSEVFHEIIGACKSLGLPLAGADRMRIGGELGVKDLTALLSYLATPEDDLALATVLRSPLGGLSETELHQIAYGRPSVLRAAFEQAKDRFPEVHEMLTDLRNMADFLRPYDLLERCLTRHKGREKLLARLGMEAEEGITALLDQAQKFERDAIPGLTNFLSWLEVDEVEIKRQIGREANEIRVMTVHGAKGLESPIVILPDTADRAVQSRGEIFDIDDTGIWKMKQEEQTEAQVAASQAVKAKAKEERRRLLYVAMTRAESWLVICGAGDEPKPDAAAWYQHAKQSLEEAGASDPSETDVVLRLEHGVWPQDLSADMEEESAPKTDIPDWIDTTAPGAPEELPVLSPSKLGGAKALPGPENQLDEDTAKLRGTMIHRLLEHLPNHAEEMWSAICAEVLGDYVSPLDENLLEIARRVLDKPELGFLFEPGSLAEVSLSALVPELEGRRIAGSIDRLVVEPDRILAVDFKSNAVVPKTAAEIPDGILRQLGAYGAGLAQIYPEHRIELAVLWTERAELMTVPHDIVRQALGSAHIS